MSLCIAGSTALFPVGQLTGADLDHVGSKPVFVLVDQIFHGTAIAVFLIVKTFNQVDTDGVRWTKATIWLTS